MDKFIAFMEDKIAPVANKLARQKYLQALQNSFMAMIPFFTIGSFALIIISPPADYTTMSPGILCSIMKGWAALAGSLAPICGYIYLVCMTVLSLVTTIGLSYNLAKHYEINTITPIYVTVSCVLIANTMSVDNVLSYTYLGGTGLFSCLIVSILSFELYRKLVEKKVGHISVDATGMPPALADSISNMVPILITLVAVSVISYVILLLTGSGLPVLLNLIMAPVVNMVNSIGGVVFMALLVMIFWWFGIHDTVITGPLETILGPSLAANAAAYVAGTAATALPFIVARPVWWTFMAIGGSGATLGLAALCMTSKAKRIKTIGRLCIVPALFNINEPLIFGLPLMYNPVMFLPFVLVMPLNGIITYLAMDSGLVNRVFVDPSWNMPAPIGAMIATMDYKAFILSIVLIVLDIAIYFPFFKIYEKQILAQESGEASEQ